MGARLANTLAFGLVNSGPRRVSPHGHLRGARRRVRVPRREPAPGPGLARERDVAGRDQPPGRDRAAAVANEPLRAALARLTGRTAVGPPPDGAILDLLDGGIVSITPVEQLRIAGALRPALP